MPRIYKISRSGLRLFYKMRHHKGHGIHSPFVFNLITKVIEEKKPYYAYQELKDYLLRFPDINRSLSKSNLLSFRLVNYFNSKKILEIGAGYGINTLCLTAPSSLIICSCIETSSNKGNISKKLYADWNRNITLYQNNECLSEIDEKQDCICINLKHYTQDLDKLKVYVLNHIHERSFIIIKGIRTNKRHQLLWKSLVNDTKVKVSLDLFNEGFLFFDPKYHKRNYKISF